MDRGTASPQATHALVVTGAVGEVKKTFGGSETPRDNQLTEFGLSVYLDQAGVGDDEQVLEKAHAWVQAQKPTSIGDIVQFNMVDDFVNALDLPIIPKTKLLGALKSETGTIRA